MPWGGGCARDPVFDELVAASGEGGAPVAMTLPARLACCLVTPVLLMACFPDIDQGWLAWVALVPLLLACRGQRWLAAGALGLASGGGAIVAVFPWIFVIDGFRAYHMGIFALYFGGFTALWCAGQTLLRRGRVPVLATVPALWVALDYLKVNAGFMAFPWATLAQSQHAYPVLLQAAAITGEYGPTFLVVMVNVAVADWISDGRRAVPKIAVAGAAVALAAAWGVREMSAGEPAAGTVRVAAVQPSMLLEERASASGRAAMQQRLERLTREAARSRPDLIAWPETAVRDLDGDPDLLERLRALAREVGAPLVVGASDAAKFAGPGEGTYELRQHNSAYFVEPGQRLAPPYRKNILVPFGEILPLEATVTWPVWLVPRLMKVIPGSGYELFRLPGGTPFSVIICWENLFAGYVRRMVGSGARIVVHISNDNWFGRTAAPRQHAMASVLRAIENRTPLLVASNTGPSQIIDGHGRVVAAQAGLFTSGVVTADVDLASTRTFYTRWGDAFAWAAICLACIGCFDALASAGRRRGRTSLER